jgi:hypothetical protein
MSASHCSHIPRPWNSQHAPFMQIVTGAGVGKREGGGEGGEGGGCEAVLSWWLTDICNVQYIERVRFIAVFVTYSYLLC